METLQTGDSDVTNSNDLARRDDIFDRDEDIKFGPSSFDLLSHAPNPLAFQRLNFDMRTLEIENQELKRENLRLREHLLAAQKEKGRLLMKSNDLEAQIHEIREGWKRDRADLAAKIESLRQGNKVLSKENKQLLGRVDAQQQEIQQLQLNYQQQQLQIQLIFQVHKQYCLIWFDLIYWLLIIFSFLGIDKSEEGKHNKISNIVLLSSVVLTLLFYWFAVIMFKTILIVDSLVTIVFAWRVKTERMLVSPKEKEIEKEG